MADTGGSTAGWYADPSDAGLLRWWDGTAWTEHLSPRPMPSAPRSTPSAAELRSRLRGAHAAGTDATGDQPTRSERAARRSLLRPRSDRAAGRAASAALG